MVKWTVTMREKFEEYYRTLAPRLTSYLVANGTTHANACEIVQDSFLKLWERRDTLEDGIEHITGLLWTIARNLRTDRFRKDKRMVYDAEAGMDEEGRAEDPGRDSDAARLRARIRQALAQLSPLLREAYVMFNVAELSVREIARQTNATEGVVKVRIFRAKQKLQELLKDLKTW